jgi:hypothetical protein
MAADSNSRLRLLRFSGWVVVPVAVAAVLIVRVPSQPASAPALPSAGAKEAVPAVVARTATRAASPRMTPRGLSRPPTSGWPAWCSQPSSAR